MPAFLPRDQPQLSRPTGWNIPGQYRSDRSAATVGGRCSTKKAVQIADVLADPEYTHGEQQKKAGYRTFLGVPLLREGQADRRILSLCRTTVQPFSEKQIELLSSFADQAVIAIENVRLFDEVQARTARTIGIAGAADRNVRSSGRDQQLARRACAVFATMLENAARVCGANFGTLNLSDGDRFRFVAELQCASRIRRSTVQRDIPTSPKRQTWNGREQRSARCISRTFGRSRHIWKAIPPLSRLPTLAGARTIVVVPMLRDAELVGTIAIYRQEVRPFTDKQIDLLEQFRRAGGYRHRE